jgi:polyhydroxybutyrate depolymerase
MRNRKTVIAAVLALINLPVALALSEAVWFKTFNRSNGSFLSAGQKREYLLYVPRSYDRTKPTPLVISMHGAGLWGAAQKETSQWNDLADQQRFIVAYPSGALASWPRIWHVDGGPGLINDVRFIADLIDTLKVSYNIDANRIYANGLSNGGGMAFVLSCTLSDRIAAVGMVAAAQTLPWKWCTDQRAVPMITFHGTHDPITPYNGGTTWISTRRFPSIPRWTANWAERNRCAQNPVDSVVATDVTRRTYTSCAEGAPVVLYTVRGGGHNWPGGKPFPEWLAGTTSNSIDATTQMWSFFSEHRLLRN